MAFASIKFLAFIIIAVCLYWILPNRFRKWLLLLLNFAFYYSFGLKNTIFLVAMIITSYCCGFLVKKYSNKFTVIISLVVSIMPLVITKYYNFAIENVVNIFDKLGSPISGPVLSVVEPIGISFFTFKIISYLVEVYRESIKRSYSFLDYAVYVSFFPTITSGPIDRPNSFIEQIRERKSWDYTRFVRGFVITLYGYFMKVVIADRLAFIVNTVYSDYQQYVGFPLFVTSVLYSLQIYLDFCGYTYIVSGIARILGYECMDNFMQPYFAVSIKDFWRRWHISLSSWLRDYIYIPLGGNRKGKVSKYRNLLTTFIVSGIWHGAGWNYLLWGLLHGIYQLIGEWTLDIRIKAKQKLKLYGTKVDKWISTTVTFILINIAWVIFWGNKNFIFWDILKAMLHKSSLTLGWIGDIGISNTEIVITFLAIIVVFLFDYLQNKKVDLLAGFFKLKLPVRYVLIYIILFTIILFGYYGAGYDASAFIYFQF